MTPAPLPRRSFASDNYAPAHPDVLAALSEANRGHAVSYGADPWTDEARRVLRAHFGEETTGYLVYNGTGANVVALSAVLRPADAILCAESAHIQVDEGGAPERLIGAKLVDIPTPDGRLTPALLETRMTGIGDQHRVQPRVVSITQSTELGTRYAIDAIRELVGWAHDRELLVHVDGSRLANAAAGLGCGLGDLTTALGVDLVSVGLTKNGGLGAEAIVVVRPELDARLPWLRKGAMQLASKQRYLAAQLVAQLGGDLWRRTASHANAMAARLAAGVAAVPGVRITQPVEANAVFAVIAPATTAALLERQSFYVWDEATGEVRWMTSWDTTPADVDAFVADLAAVAGA